MDLSRNKQRNVVFFFIVFSLVAFFLLALWGLKQGDVLSETVTVTGEVPHEITIQTKPGNRIPPTGNDEVTETIEFRPPSTLTVTYTTTVLTDANGFVTLPTITASQLPPGQYDIAIKGMSHLRKVFANQDLDGPAIKQFILTSPLLPPGDTNTPADNYVNSLDISYLATQLYTSDLRADLTHDTIVNSLDLSALLNNLYVFGDD